MPTPRVTRLLRAAALALIASLAVACANPISSPEPAPVQEMSDARQAIQSARSAGGDRYTPETLSEAEQLLAEATRDLNRGDYHGARTAALNAKQRAILAREAALRAQQLQ